jgi:hypothetical protein
VNERAAEGEQLPHSTGQASGRCAPFFFHVGQPQQARDSFAQLRRRHATGPPEKAVILLHRQVRIEAKSLRDISEACSDRLPILPNVTAGDRCGSTGRVNEAAEHSDSGRFAGTVGAEKTKDGTALDSEREILHGLDVGEALTQMLENDDGFAHFQNVIALIIAYLQQLLACRYLGAMRSLMTLFGPGSRCLCVLLLAMLSNVRAADPVAELASFSIFDKVDLAELAKSDANTLHGPPMGGRYLSVQSCYVVPGSPARQLEALKRWNPTKYRELKVFLHDDLPSSPSPANFSKLKSAPNNSQVSTLISATQKLSRDLQISREEEKKFSGSNGGGGAMPDAVVNFWSDLLANRAKLFVSGGTPAQPPYDHAANVRPNDEIKSLLKQQGKIQKHFADFLGNTGIGHAPGSVSPELYWELLDVDDQGVLTLGASYNRGGETIQVADVLYYGSGGYYVALTLQQMWPVNVSGKASTLVWRGDMISSAALESLHGVERLASEGQMVKDISKAIAIFRREAGR